MTTPSTCDPIIEVCAAAVTEVHPFETYRQANQYFAFLTIWLAFTPLELFAYPIVLTRSAADRQMIRDSHLVYLAAWIFMIFGHLIIFAPYVFALATSNPDFLIFWLESAIVPLHTILFFLVESLFIYSIYDTIGNEDASLNVLEPALVAAAYAIDAIPMAVLLSNDYGKVISYYDQAEIVAYQNY